MASGLRLWRRLRDAGLWGSIRAMVYRAFTLLLGMVVAGSSAQAAWPDDVTLSQLGTWEGENFSNADTIQRSYSRVIQQLGGRSSTREE